MGRCKTDGVGLPSPGALVSAQDSSETLVESHAAAPKAAALPDECRPCERPSSQGSGEGVVVAVDDDDDDDVFTTKPPSNGVSMRAAPPPPCSCPPTQM